MSAVLSISNLPASTNEHEIRERFCRFGGFQASRLFFHELQNMLIAEIDFVNIECAEYALKMIQTSPYPSDATLRMHVDYKDQYLPPLYQQSQDYPYNQNAANLPNVPIVASNRQNQNQYPLQTPSSYPEYPISGQYQGQQQSYTQPTQSQPQFAHPALPPSLPPATNSYLPDYGYSGTNHPHPPQITPQQSQQSQQQQSISSLPHLQQHQESTSYISSKIPNYHSHSSSQSQNYAPLPPPPQSRPLPPPLSNVQAPSSTYRPASTASSSSNYPQQQRGNSSANNYGKPSSQQQQSHSLGNTLLRAVQNIYDEEYSSYQKTSDATNSLYIDGIPVDSDEREVSHIFRPFPGFQNVRLIRKRTQSGREFFFCFIDFDDAISATVALKTLQGYRFDKKDLAGLKISFANENRQTKKEQIPSQTSNTSNKYTDNHHSNYNDHPSYSNNHSPPHNDNHRHGDYSHSPSYDRHRQNKSSYGDGYSSKSYRGNTSQNNGNQKDRTRK